MKVQLSQIGEVLAFGNVLEGSDVFDAPEDYSPERYTYVPNEDGSYNPDGFVPIVSE